MKYCPHCSGELNKDTFKKCPYCKKNLDMDDLASLVKPGETSDLNKEAKRKIWLREHSSTIVPFLTLLAGFIIGSILLFFFMQYQFSEAKSEFEIQIAELENVISKKNLASGNEKSNYEEELNKKIEIINILTQQNETLAGVINFTRRLSRNSTITPNTQNEIDFFKRNIRYLQNQYTKQKESLDATEYKGSKERNLVSIPQLFEE